MSASMRGATHMRLAIVDLSVPAGRASSAGSQRLRCPFRNECRQVGLRCGCDLRCLGSMDCRKMSAQQYPHCPASMIRLAIPVRLAEHNALLMAVGLAAKCASRVPLDRCSQCPGNPFGRKRGGPAKLGPKVPKVSSDGLRSAGLLLRLFADHLVLVGDRLLVSAGKWEGKCLQDVRRILEECYKNKVSLPGVARKVGMCPEHLSRLFHRRTGQTLTHFLMELRVAEFKRLLFSPDENITTAIFNSGFHSISQGNRAFHKICGMSPRQFRERVLHRTRG